MMRPKTVRRKILEASEGVELIEPEHRYEVEGRRLPSVSEVLDRVAPYAWDVPEWYLERGQAIHAALHYHDDADLDESTLSPIIRPYVERYREWLVFSGYEVVRPRRRSPPRVSATPGRRTVCYGIRSAAATSSPTSRPRGLRSGGRRFSYSATRR